MFKKWDYIIIVILMICSFTPEIILGMVRTKEYDSLYAEIAVEGKLYKKVNLSENNIEEIEVLCGNKKNVIKVEGDKIGIVEAECPDKICMNPQNIKKPGESLVCLPNRLMIEIKGHIEEDIIISH